MTAADYAHAAIVATLVGFIATLVIAQHRREVHERARQIAEPDWRPAAIAAVLLAPEHRFKSTAADIAAIETVPEETA